MIVLVLIIIAFVLALVFGWKKEETMLPSSGIEIPSLPATDTKFINVENLNDKNEIRSAFDKYVAEASQANVSAEGKNYTKTQIRNKSGQIVALDGFLKSTDSTIYPKIWNLLKNDDYYLVNCGQGNFGVMLNVKLFDDYWNLYQDELAWMKEWEKSMFKDMHSIVFSGIPFDQKNLDQRTEFKSGKYRYADITLPDGTKGSLNYNIVFDSIIMTNSQDCLKKVSDDCETLEP